MEEARMPRDIFVKPITADNPQELKQAFEWLKRIQNVSNFDADVLRYPATSLLCAYTKQDGQPLLYVPIQRVYMLDALGPNPLAQATDIAAALAQIIKTAAWTSWRDGHGEVYFPCNDEGVNGLAMRHSFTLMDYETPPPEPTPENPTPQPGKAVMPFLKLKVYS